MKQIVTITGENLSVVTNNLDDVAKKIVKTKAQMRIEALKAAGVDVSNYFTMGENNVVKAVNGAIVAVTDDEFTIDAVGKKITEGGYISNWSLFRRWVMAQMFRYLRDMQRTSFSFNELLQKHGYEYQWQMLERELYAQAKMQKHGDTTNFRMRNRWFNCVVVTCMALDYLYKLKAYVDKELTYNKRGKAKHTCHGIPYVRLQNTNVFVSDLNKKVYEPLRKMINEMKRESDIMKLYKLVHKFNQTRKHLRHDTKQSDAFVSAYKGSGAYFTMRNLIMFHGARFLGQSETISLSEVEKYADSLDDEGWKMMGLLKKLIKDSNISIQGKIDEWRK